MSKIFEWCCCCQCVGSDAGGCHGSVLVEYVVVPALPRHAAVEWQVTAALGVVSWLGRLSLAYQLHTLKRFMPRTQLSCFSRVVVLPTRE